MKKKTWAHIERDVTAAAHRDEVASLQSQIEHYKEELIAAQKSADVALGLSKSKATGKPLAVSLKDKSEAVAVALASDWHVEETINAASVNGLNEYSLDIAQNRIEKFFKGVVRLTEIERAGADIDTCLLWLGGDLMSGHIHEELAETNSLSPVQTLVWLQKRLLDGIATLKANFDRLMIVTSYGNHGRDTRKPRHATGAAHSYEWLLYKLMEDRTSGDGIEWQVGESYHNLVSLYDRTIRFHHGDGLQYQGGVGGLTIPVEKAIASWNKSPARADLDVFGHWHQQQQNPKWCSNGSLIGYNAYAISIKAAYEPPQQTYFLFDKKRGRTMTAPIIVGGA